MLLLRFFVIAIAFCATSTFAQKSEKEEFKKWEQDEKYASKVSNDGASISPGSAELLNLLKNELRRYNHNVANYNPDPDAKTALKKMQEIAAAAPSGSARQDYRFHYFKKTADQEFDICWEVLKAAPGFEEVLQDVHDRILTENAGSVACQVFRSSHARLEASCFGPVLSYGLEEDEPKFKKKVHLFSEEPRVRRSKCGGLAEETGTKRVFSPYSELVPNGTKKEMVRHWMEPDAQALTLSLNPVVDEVTKRAQQKLQEEMEQKLKEKSDLLNKDLPPITQDPTTPTVFGNPKEKSIAMLIDFSSSVDDVREPALESMKMTVLGLKETQSFTIAFLTGNRIFFNGGKSLPATPENKAAAVEWLENNSHMGSGNEEPFAEGFKTIKTQNPGIEKIYIFTDGEFSKDEIRDERNIIPSIGAPIDVRAMGKAKHSVLHMIANKSGGRVIEGEFSTSSLGEYQKRMEEIKKYREKAKEISQKLGEERKLLESENVEAVNKLRRKIQRFRDALHGRNGMCPDSFNFDE